MKSIDAARICGEGIRQAKNAAFLDGMSSSSDLVDAELNLAKVRTERIRTTITMSHWPSCSKRPASAIKFVSYTCTVPTPVPFISTRVNIDNLMKKEYHCHDHSDCRRCRAGRHLHQLVFTQGHAPVHPKRRWNVLHTKLRRKFPAVSRR